MKERVKDHFENEAHEFDSTILKMIPHYETMVRALVGAIPFEKSAPVHILDLGCGTGAVSMQAMKSFPNAQITCLDLSESMIATAKAKLARFPKTNYIVADFETWDFLGRYDAVVSSLALHHLETDQLKQLCCRKIFESLKSGGVFFNADIVLASSDFLQKAYLDEWRKFMARSISLDEIAGKWLVKYREEDHPAKLTDHLEWLAQIGFAGVEVVWKYFNFAVFGGGRP